MKNTKITLLVLILMFSHVACHEGYFEDVAPVTGSEPNITFSTEMGAEQALIGAYDFLLLNDFWGGGGYITDVFKSEKSGLWCPNGISQWINAERGIWTSKARGDFISGNWRALYNHVNRANSFLHYIHITEFRDPERKKQTIAEAKFIRALNYYLLVMLFGDVPLMTSPDDPLFPSREKADKVWQFIIDELEEAQFVLPHRYGKIFPNATSNEDGRANKYAAQALLAKCYMSAPDPGYDLGRAVELLENIIDNGEFQLLDNFGDLWDVTNKHNSEGIFMIAKSTEGDFNGTHLPDWTRKGQVWWKPYNPESPYVSPQYSFYEDTVIAGDTVMDLRRDETIWTFDEVVKDENGNVVFGEDGLPQTRPKEFYDHKYYKRANVPAENDMYSDENSYFLRYADILLLYAEALNKQNFPANKETAINYVNMVRDRAYGFPSYDHHLVDPAEVSSQDELALIIEDERRKELFFELHIFYDMKRTGRFVGFYEVDPMYMLLPLPEDEIQTNQNLLPNNPGY